MTSLSQIAADGWKELSRGVLNTQRFYRSLCRNGYNLGLLLIEDGASPLELRVVIVARSNYAPWVRSDHTGFEVMLGEIRSRLRWFEGRGRRPRPVGWARIRVLDPRFFLCDSQAGHIDMPGGLC